MLELARVLAGPVCGQILADLGADVVKIERPGVGDETRQWGPPFLPPAKASDATGEPGENAAAGEEPGPSAYYLSANRGKRSLALDFSTDDGRAVLHDLIRRADVLIENFLPDSLNKLGLTPEQLRRLNPRLVTASISGYGRTGPLAEKPGYDLVLQATAGIMSITGEPEGSPMKIGVAITDVITGLYAAIAALAGLAGRQQEETRRAEHGCPDSPETGGQWSFDLALADCTLASLVNVAQAALITDQRPRRYGNAHPQIVPYEAFATADGHLVLAVGNDRQWERFTQAAGSDDLRDDTRFATNPDRVAHRQELVPALQRLFRERTTDAWIALLTRHDVPHGPVVPLDEFLKSPQVAARQMVPTVEDAAGRRYKLIGSPLHWPGQPDKVTRPPALGEHTAEVLRDWLGYDSARLAQFTADSSAPT